MKNKNTRFLFVPLYFFLSYMHFFLLFLQGQRHGPVFHYLQNILFSAVALMIFEYFSIHMGCKLL